MTDQRYVFIILIINIAYCCLYVSQQRLLKWICLSIHCLSVGALREYFVIATYRIVFFLNFAHGLLMVCKSAYVLDIFFTFIIFFLSHLSHSDKLSFCDQSLSIVRRRPSSFRNWLKMIGLNRKNMKISSCLKPQGLQPWYLVWSII